MITGHRLGEDYSAESVLEIKTIIGAKSYRSNAKLCCYCFIDFLL